MHRLVYYAFDDGLYTLLFPDKTDIHAKHAKKTEFQLAFSFWGECGYKNWEAPVPIIRFTEKAYCINVIHYDNE